MIIIFDEMVATLILLEQYVPESLQQGLKKSDIQTIRRLLDRNVCKYFGERNSQIKEDFEYIKNFNSIVDDIELKDELLNSLNILIDEEKEEVNISIQKIIQLSKSIIDPIKRKIAYDIMRNNLNQVNKLSAIRKNTK